MREIRGDKLNRAFRDRLSRRTLARLAGVVVSGSVTFPAQNDTEARKKKR
jgi:hypothetical protein